MTDLISRKALVTKLSKGYRDKKLQQAKDDPCVIDAMIDWAIRAVNEIPLESPWHTGTPTEEGWYLIEAKDWEKQRVYYVPDYVSVHDLVLPTVQSFYESHLWQKIELSDEAKDLEKKITSFEPDKEN